MSETLKSILSAVAPTRATALAGPFAGMAVSAISDKMLGKPDGSLKEIEAVISAGGPTALAQLKQIDADFETKMTTMGVDLEKIASADKDSARNREIQLQDPTTRRLAYIALFGFFIVLFIQFYLAIEGISISTEVQRTIDITTGVLFAWVLAVKDYYFGSSAGSAQKNFILGGKK